MKQFWNDRYTESEFAYGKEPNQFLKEHIHLLPKGKVLFVAEGEGRNAVFASKNGYQVAAFDYSDSGRKKTLALALENNVEIEYEVSDVLQLSYQKNSFDAIVFIFAHFPSDIRKEAHQELLGLIKPNGKVLFEAFEKEQICYTSGGPKDSTMLFSEDEVRNEFVDITFDFLKTELVILNEGPYHQGEGKVIRFIGTKNI
jgi:2-polyprenyl-3-methyl-5-hydroxy-6-metoxy-1,4-benzoquinol methylase